MVKDGYKPSMQHGYKPSQRIKVKVLRTRRGKESESEEKDYCSC